MSDFLEVKISGLDELQKSLEQLGDKAGLKTLRAAGRAGGEAIRDEMVLQAPKDSGLLAEHHDVKTRKQRGEPLALTVTIGPNNKTVIHKQDKGRTAGLPRTARALAAMLEWGTSKMVKKPYLTRAYEVAKTKAVDRVIEVLKEKLGL
jgi:HK97 gp10 family phage protein